MQNEDDERPIAGVVSVAIDCPDPRRLAAFYAGLLKAEVLIEDDDYACVRLDNLWLNMLRVENYVPPTWPWSERRQHLHLDFSVSDLDVGQRAALQAGAVVAEVQPQPNDWRVFLDPDGHAFCLTLQTMDSPSDD